MPRTPAGSGRAIDSAGEDFCKSVAITGLNGSYSSLIPSAKLEQEAHKFGFREREAESSAMDSPQQMQILGFILLTKAGEENRSPVRMYP
jgi:hypothetical protein